MLNKTQMITKYLGEELTNEINTFCDEVINRNCAVFSNEEELKEFFDSYIEEFNNKNDYKSIELLRYYTGIAYKDINAILRGNWNYEVNGALTNEKEAEMRTIISEMDKIYLKNSELPKDIKTYRGVSLSSFKDFGITSIEDLPNLVGKLYYEPGFTSTSLVRDRSFFDRELEYHSNCDIEIEFFVPQEANDGIPFVTDEFSYSKSQTEFLINCGSLSKITNVTLSKNKDKAYIQMTLIPKKVWDKTYAEYIDMQR